MNVRKETIGWSTKTLSRKMGLEEVVEYVSRF